MKERMNSMKERNGGHKCVRKGPNIWFSSFIRFIVAPTISLLTGAPYVVNYNHAVL